MWFSMQRFQIFNYTAHIQHNLWQGLWQAAVIQSASLPKIAYKSQVREEHPKSSHNLGCKRA